MVISEVLSYKFHYARTAPTFARIPKLIYIIIVDVLFSFDYYIFKSVLFSRWVELKSQSSNAFTACRLIGPYLKLFVELKYYICSNYVIILYLEILLHFMVLEK